MPETNNGYDMQRLQQEAIRRAREMQARAQSTAVPPPPAARHEPTRGTSSVPMSGAVPVRHAPPPEPQHNPVGQPHMKEEPTQPDFKNILPGPVGDIFDSLMADSERTLILVLLLILVEEKADTGVILALMYLIL